MAAMRATLCGAITWKALAADLCRMQTCNHDKPVEWPHLGWQRMQVQASQRRMDGSYMTDGANTCTGAAFQAANLVSGADA